MAKPMPDLKHAAGADVRRLARDRRLTGPTCGLAEDFAQANLVVLPKADAFDFLLFCQRNPKPCPVLDVTKPGSPTPGCAPDADLRTDLPGYCVCQRGELVAEPADITNWWRDDLVAFLLGCSFTFEHALVRAGIPMRHLELGRNVPMFKTNIPCVEAGPFHGPLVVSMRPMTPRRAIQAIEITSRFTDAHGAPIHLGDPGAIGIPSLERPDYGEAVEIRPGEVPVFWACGVTPQAVARIARPELLITHKPGHMFVTDRRVW
jgi:uncharacterized protein YcsI (UPF0317 family)